MFKIKFYNIGPRSLDFAKILTELGQDQKFDVVFIAIDEASDDDQVQVLVQLSMAPVSSNVRLTGSEVTFGRPLKEFWTKFKN